MRRRPAAIVGARVACRTTHRSTAKTGAGGANAWGADAAALVQDRRRHRMARAGRAASVAATGQSDKPAVRSA